MVSMSSAGGLGLKHYAVEKFGADSKAASMTYTQGDVNTTLIRTEKGRTITLYYDTTLPRPFQMIYRLQGTKGIYHGDLGKVYFEGLSPKEHNWEDEAAYSERYDHPMWRTLGEKAKGYSHGGGDYMMIYQFLAAVRAGVPTPIDVYDSVAWSVISPLSEKSTAMRSRTACGAARSLRTHVRTRTREDAAQTSGVVTKVPPSWSQFPGKGIWSGSVSIRRTSRQMPPHGFQFPALIGGILRGSLLRLLASTTSKFSAPKRARHVTSTEKEL